MTLRVAMAVLLALALLDGALGRPHDNELPPIRHHHHRHHHHAALERRQLCGANLSEALRHLCAGRGYNSPDSASGSSRRGGSGVATECCQEGCSQQDLEEYCQPRKNSPPPVSDASPETTDEQPTDSASVDSTPNHIRHSVESNGNSEPANKPTVVGGKVSLNMPTLQYNASEMIKVGTVKQPHLIPVRISVRHKSNSLK